MDMTEAIRVGETLPHCRRLKWRHRRNVECMQVPLSDRSGLGCLFAEAARRPSAEWSRAPNVLNLISPHKPVCVGHPLRAHLNYPPGRKRIGETSGRSPVFPYNKH
jgi:hypothetical protein